MRKNHMIISSIQKKTFHNIQYAFVIKTQRIGREGAFFSLIKNIYEIPGS